jgi:hypothetical protein
MMIGASAVQAQDKDMHIGGQITASVPLSTIGGDRYLDNKLGLGVGINMIFPLSFFPAGTVVEPRFDYAIYKDCANRDTVLKTFRGGLDLDYYFSKKTNKGFYAGVGAGFSAAEFDQNGTLSGNQSDGFYAVQVGDMLTKHMGVEVRYIYTQYKPKFVNGTQPEIDCPTLDASFIYRF